MKYLKLFETIIKHSDPISINEKDQVLKDLETFAIAKKYNL